MEHLVCADDGICWQKTGTIKQNAEAVFDANREREVGVQVYGEKAYDPLKMWQGLNIWERS